MDQLVSNFVSPKVTQGLAGAGSALAQLFPLVVYYFGKWFLGRTPRQAFNVRSLSFFIHMLFNLVLSFRR